MLLLAMGSRGDVEPMVALAAGLAAAGQPARVLGLAAYEPLARAHGVDFVPVHADLEEALALGEHPAGRLLLSTAAGQGLVLQRWMRAIREPLTRALLDTLDDGPADEVVLTGVLTRDVAVALAEARGSRPVTVLHTGQLPSTAPESYFFGHWFLPPGVPGASSYNRWGTRQNWVISTSLGRAVGVHVRRALGLGVPSVREAVARADRHPTLVTASPLLVPRAPDWPATVHQTGQLVLEARDVTPDPAITDFLAAGPPPVYVGFGSMTQVSGERARSLVVRAAELSGHRVLTPADPGTPTHPLSPDVLAVAHVPHSWLLPRTAGVVHHGGAGTTGTTLRAGVPSAAVPFGADQPFHARRLHELGVGPPGLPIRRLAHPRRGPERLAGLLRELVDGPRASSYARRAREVGELVRAEDGVGDTVRWLLAGPKDS